MNKLAKMAGQFLLLAAFIGQFIFLDRMKEIEGNMDKVSEGYLLTRIASLQYVTLYTQTNDELLLRKSAIEEANAVAMIVIASDRDKTKITEIIKDITQQALEVSQIAQYNNFINVLAKIHSENHRYFDAHRDKINKRVSISWYVVFALSFFGLLLMWWGELSSERSKGSSKRDG